jgi:hypothetical protein
MADPNADGGFTPTPDPNVAPGIDPAVAAVIAQQQATPAAPAATASTGTNANDVQIAQIAAQTAAAQLAAQQQQNSTTNASAAQQATVAQQGAALADQQAQAAQAATAAANQQDFAQAVSEFNQNHALALQQFGLTQQAQQFTQAVSTAGLTGQYNGQQTQAAQQQAFNQATTTAGLTGQIAGSGDLASAAAKWQAANSAAGNPNTHTEQFASQPASVQAQYGYTAPQQTLAGQAQQAALSGLQANGTPTEATQQFNTSTASDMAKLASSLSGPADYFKYLTSLNNGNSILGALNTGSSPMPAFGATGQQTPQSLQNIFSSLGMGGSAAGATPAAGQPAAAGGPVAAGGTPGATGAMPAAAGSTSTTPGTGGTTAAGTSTSTGVTIPGFESFGSLPQPHQINPVNWDSLGPVGQQFMQGAYAAAGYDPNSIAGMVNATRPAGQYANASGGQSSAGSNGNTISAPSTGAFG